MKEKLKQIIFILLIIQLLLSIHVDFCLEHNNSNWEERFIMSQAEVIQEGKIVKRCIVDANCLTSGISLFKYNTIQKACNHNIYAKKIIIHRRVGKKQLARKDLSGDDSVPVYGCENMI
nr:MAG TPA: hypothetical protein [Caudoviricetes sp.]